MSTTPWPSRTETPPLVFPLKARRSETQAFISWLCRIILKRLESLSISLQPAFNFNVKFSDEKKTKKKKPQALGDKKPVIFLKNEPLSYGP